jgi:hypothetical protein
VRRFLICVLLALCAGAGMASTPVPTDYKRADNKPPTDADLVLINGNAKTLVIRVLNLTPYQIVEDTPAIMAEECTNTDRDDKKSMMIAPVGWPSGFPAVPGDWKQNEDMSWGFIPKSPNTEIHPYNFAVAWDDQKSHVDNSTMGWVVKGVYTANHAAPKDVKLRLWMTRTKPDDKLKSKDFKLVSSCVMEMVALLGVAVDPASPFAWLDIFVATKELASSSFEAANTEETGGDKMYFAAYAIPDSNSQCYSAAASESCTPATFKATDGIVTEWGSGIAGDNAAEIMVTTHMLRGEDANDWGDSGFVPQVGVVVWTADEYKTAYTMYIGTQPGATSAARRITSHLRQSKMKGYAQFQQLVHSLPARERQAFDAAYEAMRTGKHPSQEQTLLLEGFAKAFEQGHTSLKGRPGQQRPAHTQNQEPSDAKH